MEAAAATTEPAAGDTSAPAAGSSDDAPQPNMAAAASDSMAAATSMNVLETYLQNFNQELQTPVPGGAAAGAAVQPVAVAKFKGEDQSADDSAEEEGALTVVENQEADPSVPAAPAAVPVSVPVSVPVTEGKSKHQKSVAYQC